MARVVKPLTDLKIRKAAPKEKVYRLFDGNGLHLEISPTGSKLWRLKFTYRGRERRMSLGRYPDVSLREAREAADEARRAVRKGIDPIEEKRRSKRPPEEASQEPVTFKDFVEEYFAHRYRIDGETPYLQRNHNRMKNHAYTHRVARVPVGEIRRADVTELVVDTLERAGAETARRVLAFTKETLEHAIDRGVIEFNVAAGLRPRRLVGKREHRHFPVMTDPRELAELQRAIEGYRGDYSTRQALRVAPLLALRPGNLRRLRWEWIDRANRLIEIPAEAMKMHRPHRLPYGDTVATVLEEMEPYSGEMGHVFPSHIHFSEDRPLSENALNLALRRMGYTGEQIVSHSFRSIFATLAREHMEEHGAQDLAIELYLAHRDPDTIRETYNRATMLKELRKLAEWWDGYWSSLENIEELVG